MAHRCHLHVLPAALALLVGLTVTACGGSSDKTSSPSTSAASTSTTASASTTSPPADTDRVMKAGLLRASDLPRTWKDSGESSVSGSSDAQIKVAKTITACRDFAATVERENAQTKVPSNKFVDAAAASTVQGQVSNEVVAWPSSADARTAYRAYSASSMKSCLDALFRKLVLQEAAGSGVDATVSVDDLPVPDVGDDAIGYQAVVTLTGAASQQIAFVVEIVRSGQYTVSYNATMYKAAPTDFGKNLVVRSIARLEAAQSN